MKFDVWAVVFIYTTHTHFIIFVDVEMALIIAISNPLMLFNLFGKKFHHDQTDHQLYR